MIRWCVYCQQFQGESFPYDNLAITHGLCAACAAKGTDRSDKEFERIQELKTLQMNLWNAGKDGDRTAAKDLIKTALDQGIRPLDVLIGLLAPLLYKLGADWAAGKVTIAEEHEFTSLSESVFDMIAELVREKPAHKTGGGPLDVLLVNADRNHHTLGPRMLGLFFENEKINSKVYYPGLPPQETLNLLMKFRPAVLGISISMPEQLESVKETVGLIRSSLPPVNQTHIFLGGFAVKQGLIPAIEGTTQFKEPKSLKEMAQKILALKIRQTKI